LTVSIEFRSTYYIATVAYTKNIRLNSRVDDYILVCHVHTVTGAH